MIEAGFFKREDGFCVVISGHANYAPEGQDIVCASVSALLYGLIGYLGTVEQSKVRVRKLVRGYAELTCSQAGEEALRMACIGILQVSERYPAHVRVHNEIWSSRLCAPGATSASPSRNISGDSKRRIHIWKKILSRNFPSRKIL